jgi:L-alanine-DL-glutamate epimerase-like enolase superfamily enzyme
MPGAHWGRFIRTIVEVVTDDGIVGLGELGGGGGSGGGYTYDRDPSRPDWYATVPEYRCADPGSP